MLLVGGRTLSFVLGISAGLGLARPHAPLQSQLWGVTPTDLPTFAAEVHCSLVALVAAFLPVRRATSVNPTVALRGGSAARRPKARCARRS